MPKSIDVVILSWDRPEDTIEAIESAIAQKEVDANIIVFDQGSRCVNARKLRSFCEPLENVNFIENSMNVGVPSGRNQGCIKGTSKYIVLLDNDAVFADQNCLNRAIKVLESSDTLGALSLGVENFYSNAASPQPDKTSWTFGRRPVERDWKKVFKARAFVGAGAVLKRSVFEQSDGFDGFLFFLHEEEDLSKRIINLGYEIEYRGDIRIRHKVSGEHRVYWKGKRSYYNARNRLYLNFKFGAPISQILSDSVILIVAGARGGCLFSTLEGTIAGISSFSKARECRANQKGLATTSESIAYHDKIKTDLIKIGTKFPLDEHKGMAKFLRRLKWETGFMVRKSKPILGPKQIEFFREYFSSKKEQ